MDRSSSRITLAAVLSIASAVMGGLSSNGLLSNCLATAHAEAAAASAPLSVTAKLVEIPTSFPPDELYDYAYVMRYEVIGGPMDRQSILVAHYKPRQPRAKIKDQMKAHVSGKLRSFKQGDVHKLQLSAELKRLWQGALVDEFAATDRKSTRYWALVADPS